MSSFGDLSKDLYEWKRNDTLLKQFVKCWFSEIPGCRKILMSYSSSEAPRKPSTLVPATEEPICIVVGAIAKGMIETDYTEENISISNYPLSAALTCSKLCDAFEEAWGVF